MATGIFPFFLLLLTTLLRPAAPPTDAPPDVPREFRGAWIATVDNIDWPSAPGLPAATQQAELRAMLDRAVQLNLNAVILQVRPAGDALYASAYEPWSYYLTGASGRPPEPYYDPLAFAVEEAHRRGLELHAWFNPYRAKHPTQGGPPDPMHLSRLRPDLVRTYGDLLWMDPGEPDVQQHSLDVMLDVVRRYDIDGLHLDDYFYPYPVKARNGGDLDFPDDASWARAQPSFAGSRSDWRRANVDRFIERLYREVKALKPWVKVGISPFGIWRPGYPAQIKGFDAYDRLYADARRWLHEGWLDYLAPQLYWPIDQTAQSYPVLLDWWIGENTGARHIWPGNFTSRIRTGSNRWPTTEVINQIAATRASGAAGGNIHFSMSALMPDASTLGPELANSSYARPALVPASPWLAAPSAPAPTLQLESGPEAVLLNLKPANDAARLWVVRARRGGAWTTEFLPAWRLSATLKADASGRLPDRVGVSAVNRVGIESEIVYRDLP